MYVSAAQKLPLHIRAKDFIFGFLPLRARAFVAGIFCSDTEN
jgi:hypothetical protein